MKQFAKLHICLVCFVSDREVRLVLEAKEREPGDEGDGEDSGGFGMIKSSSSVYCEHIFS